LFFKIVTSLEKINHLLPFEPPHKNTDNHLYCLYQRIFKGKYNVADATSRMNSYVELETRSVLKLCIEARATS